MWTLITVEVLLHASLFVFLYPVYGNFRQANYELSRFFLRGFLFLTGSRVTRTGMEYFPKTGGFILMSNHQSNLDIPILLVTAPRMFSIVSKQEVIWFPIIGQDLVIQGHFVVDRKKPRKAYKQMERIRKRVEGGNPLLIFPEGTRTKTGQLGAFKRGSFKMALQTGMPIVPCYIQGSFEALPKHRFLMRPSKITVLFGPAIPVEKVVFASKPDEKQRCEALSEKVREAVLVLEAKVGSGPR